MSFPDDTLQVQARAFLKGAWVEFGPIFYVYDDFYVDVYLDVYLGKVGHDPNRLPSQELEFFWGRADELSQASPSSLSILLWNHDGVLSTLPDATYYPDWDLGAHFQFLIEGDVVFDGTVSAIEPTWPFGDLADESDEDSDPGVSFVTVTVNGILRRLSQARTLQSALHRAALDAGTDVTDYFPMEDAPGSDTITSAFPGRDPMLFSGLTLGQADLGAGSLPVTSCSTGSYECSVIGKTGAWSFELAKLNLPTAPTGAERATWVIRCTGGTINRFVIDVYHDGGQPVIAVAAYDASMTLLWRSPTPDPPDLFGVGPVLLRLDLAPSGSDTTWVISWLPLEFDHPGFAGGTTSPGTLGKASAVRFDCLDFTVEQGHLLIDDLAFGWNVFAAIGWESDTATGRMIRLCDENDVAFTHKASTDLITSARLGPQGTGTLLDELLAAAIADGGLLTEDGLGLKYLPRASYYNQPVALTLDAGTSDIANPFEPVRDDQKIRNDVTVARPDGSTARQFGQDSIDRYGLYPDNPTLNLFGDDQLVHAAGWELHLGTFSGLRYPQVTVDLGVRPEISEQVRAVQVGDRIRVTNLPPQHHSYADLIVEGIQWLIGPKSWVVTFNCSPAKPWDVFVMSEQPLGNAGCVLGAAVDETDTELQLVSVASDWTTDSDDFPIQMVLTAPGRDDGEEVTVTDITGSGTQTADVVRAVNGVHRAWPAGTNVQVTSGVLAR